MHISSLNFNLCISSIKIFILKFTYLATIHSVCPFSSKLLNVELISTSTNFFIWSKSYTYFTMLYFGVIYKILHGIHYLCYTCFIVCAQKSSTICYDNVITFEFQQFCKILRRKYYIICFIKNNILSIIIFNYSWINIFPTHIRARIKMRYKTNYRYILLSCIRRESCHKITIVIQTNIN